MTTIYKYKIYCTTDNQFEYIWDTVAPTTCPVNVGHSVNLSSVHFIKIINVYKTETANITADGNNFYRLDTTTNNIVMVLPSTSDNQNRVLIIQRLVTNINSVTIVVDNVGTDTINGAGTSTTLTTNRQTRKLKCVGTNWQFLNISTYEGEDDIFTEGNILRDTDNTDPGNSNYFLSWDDTQKRAVYRQIDYSNLSGAPSTISIESLTNVDSAADPGNSKHYLGWNDLTNQWINRQIVSADINTTLDHIVIGGGSTGMTEIKYNLSATVAPTITNDSAGGYRVGSRWINITADQEYVCVDATVGAAVWINSTSQGVLTLEGLNNVNSAADPGDNSKFLRWNDTSNQWVDDFVRLKSDTYVNLDLIKQTGVLFRPSDSDNLIHYDGTSWKHTKLKEVVEDNLTSQVELFNPTVWFRSDDISGGVGTVAWSSYTGAGSIFIQGGATNYSTSVGGRKAINIIHTPVTSSAYIFGLNLGATYNASTTGFTIAMTTQNWDRSASTDGRFVSIISNDVVPDGSSLTNLRAIYCNGASSTLSSFRNAGNIAWSTTVADSVVDSNPTVVVMRYNPVGTEWKVWINKTADSVATITTLDLSLMTTIQYLYFGYDKSNPTATAGKANLRLSDLQFYNSVLNDTQVAELSSVILRGYGIRTPAYSNTIIYKDEIEDLSNVDITSAASGQLLQYNGTNWINTLKSKYNATSGPLTTNDSTEGYVVGSRWFDITNKKEHVCVDNTASAAVWKETSGGGSSNGVFSSVFQFRNDTAVPTNGQIVFLNAGNINQNNITTATKVRISKKDINLIDMLNLGSLTIEKITVRRQGTGIANTDSVHSFTLANSNTDQTTYYDLGAITDKTTAGTSLANGDLIVFDHTPKSFIANISDVTITSVSAGQFLHYNGTRWINTLKSEYAKTTAPTSNDDSADGYVIGSRWLNLTNNKEYVCLNNTVGSAVWVETTVASNIATNTDVNITGNSALQITGQMALATDTRRLYVYSGTNWTYTVMNNWLLHSNIDTLLSPVFRVKPSGLGGTSGAITWTASSGTPVLTQSGAIVPETATINTGPALYIPQDEPYLHIDLGATYLGSSGFTLFVLVQDLSLDTSISNNRSRFVTLLDATPAVGGDDDNTTNIAVFVQNSTTDNFATIFNNITYVWTTGTITGTSGTPTLIVAKYSAGTTELKTFVNSTNALTQTVNLNTLSIRNIALGYGQASGLQDGGLRVAEIIFWNSALDDNRVQLVTNILTDNYGITSTDDADPNPIPVSDGGTGHHTLTNNGILVGQGDNPITALKSEFSKTNAPICLNDTSQGYTVGSIWFDTTNDKEYVCIDATLNDAKWKLKTEAVLKADTLSNILTYVNKEDKTLGLTTDGNKNIIIREYDSTSGYRVVPVKEALHNSSNSYTTFHKEIDSSTLHLRATSDGIDCTVGTLTWTNSNNVNIITAQSGLVYSNINNYPAIRAPTDSAYATINTGSVVDFSTDGGMTLFFVISNVDCVTAAVQFNRVFGWTNQAYPTAGTYDIFGSSNTQPTNGGISFNYQQSLNQLSWFLEQPSTGTAQSFITTNTTSTTPLVVCLQYDSATQLFECWYNKVSQGTKARTNYLNVKLQHIHLFVESNGTPIIESSCGTISEIVLFDSKISSGDITIINNLLFEKYVNNNIVTSILNEYNLGDLDDVDVNTDPNNDHKYLRWNNTNNKWTDDFIIVGSGAREINNTGRITVDPTNETLLVNTGTSIRSLFLNKTSVGYAFINSAYSPTVRWIPEGITGTQGQLSWNASVGAGTLGDQGYKANYVVASIGGKKALYIDSSSNTDASKYVRLDLGATYAGTGDFTTVFVVQNFTGYGSSSRFISLLDATPTSGADSVENTNISAIQQDGATANLESSFNSIDRTWTPGSTITSVDSNPTVIVIRYTHGTTEWKIWINKTTDTVVTTNTINMGSLSVRNIQFGKNNVSDSNSGVLRVSEVIFWDSPLTDQQVADVSNDILIEYGVRTSSANLGYYRTTAPGVNDDITFNYNIGTRWIDTTNDNEYVCLDNTDGAAVWKNTTTDRLEALLNVNTAVDPADEHRFLRWNDTTNEWVDSFIRIKTDIDTNITNATTYETLNQMVFATDTRRLYVYRNPNWAYMPFNNRMFYNNINEMLPPILRLEPTGIGGTTGAVTWTPSIGTVTVSQSGSNIPETATVNTGPAIRIIEDTPYVHLDLGTNYSGATGFTIVFVVQDLVNDPVGNGDNSRFLTLLDDTPLAGADHNNTTNLRLFARSSATNNFATVYNNTSYTWTTGTITGTASTPTVITARYSHGTTQFASWVNNSSANSSTVNMGSLVIRNIALGYSNFIVSDDDGGLRIAEIIFWNSALSDSNVSVVRQILMDKYNIAVNKDVQEVGFNIEDMINVSSAADPADDHKFLRWNNTINKWVDDYIRAKEVLICEESVPGKGTIYMDTGTKDLLYHDGTNWRNAVTVQTTNRYASLNTYYSPTVRWIPKDIYGVTGSLVWSSTVGSGTIYSQGSNLSSTATSLGGKTSIYVNPSVNNDTSYKFILDLGASYSGSGDFTFAFVVQDLHIFSSGFSSRLITLLDSTPETSNDHDNVTNIAALYGNASNNFSTLYNSTNYVHTLTTNTSGTTGNPTVIIMRYKHSSTEWKIWINRTTDTVQTTNTINLGSLTVKTVGLGYANFAATGQGRIRVSEVIFWDSPLTDENVERISCDILTEYTVRTDGLQGGQLTMSNIGDIQLTNPQVNDIIKYNGDKWVNTTSGSFSTWVFSDTKTLGTVGGTATINVWTTRILNTTNITSGAEVTLSSNQLTIGGGSWIVDITSIFHNTDETKLRFRNITDSVTVLSSLNITVTNNNFITLSIPLTISSPKIYEIQYYVSATNANTDLGFPSGIDSEVYTYIKLTKLSSTLSGWIITDSKTTGSVGGTATIGAWTTRSLNTTKLSGGSNVTLSANQLTFAAGSYFIDIQSPFNNTDQTRLRLMNISDSISELTSYSRTITDNSYITINATVTFTSTKTVEIQYYATTTNNTTDLGIPDGIASDETYTMVRVIKI